MNDNLRPTSPEGISPRRLRMLVLGAVIGGVGLLGIAAGGYYATELVRIPEFRVAWLTNLMGAIFWGGALLFAIGIGFVLAAPRR